jgi:polysaccharide lyase-like protein
MTIVQDATAPQSPTNVGSMNFNAGMAGGNSPASLERQVPHTTTLYVSTWVKFSTNWQSHSSGVNKILHLWINGGNKLVITAAGYVADGPLTARVSLQGIAGGGNAEGGVTGLYETNAQFVRGQWTKIEVIAVANTSGANGSVKLFINGALVVNVSGIAYVAGSGTWDLAMWSPTWGGTGDTVKATQHMYMDHIYLSGK